MINSVTVTNHRGLTQKIKLRSPEESGLCITKIDGIAANEASINTTEIATADGAYFNSARVNTRNIVIDIKLLPNPTMEDTRHLLYGLFQTKWPVRLVFESDSRDCYIDGYVESAPVEIFNKSQTAKVSIICVDPYFKDVNESTTLFAIEEPHFEFPIGAAGSYMEDTSSMDISILNPYAGKNIYYGGEDSVGVNILMHFAGSVGDLTIYNTTAGETMKLISANIATITGHAIQNADEIRICTEKGNKTVYLMRNGIEYNILNALDTTSDWFTIGSGDNNFVYTATSGISNIQFEIKFRGAFNGV